MPFSNTPQNLIQINRVCQTQEVQESYHRSTTQRNLPLRVTDRKTIEEHPRIDDSRVLELQTTPKGPSFFFFLVLLVPVLSAQKGIVRSSYHEHLQEAFDAVPETGGIA